LISLYRALGGGWQVRESEAFVRADIRDAMAERTDWGRLLEEEEPPEEAERPIPLPEF